ncbi:hypothetical protein K8M07_07790 [Schnuerera sp. xch1]|uniref:hypothetical protein n=1 Tax=Schnuerera sp. xch1 TaxID=2874283 RepID=UPI001CBDC360|nr:hypothetical protein [Schnuerera sp. xch1]MBZ2175156.1 hypothetical protein [Schnuerera sp. xch1]
MVNPLARVVMNNVSKKNGYTKNFGTERKVNNLTSKDEDMLKEIINKDRQVQSHTKRKTIITLDEAVNRVKGGDR